MCWEMGLEVYRERVVELLEVSGRKHHSDIWSGILDGVDVDMSQAY